MGGVSSSKGEEVCSCGISGIIINYHSLLLAGFFIIVVLFL